MSEVNERVLGVKKGFKSTCYLFVFWYVMLSIRFLERPKGTKMGLGYFWDWGDLEFGRSVARCTGFRELLCAPSIIAGAPSKQ